jgi:UDP-glucose 4-epimerase
MVIPTFVKQALFGHPITIHGDGKQSRSFTFVGDVVKALINLANHAGAVGQVFNIGSDQETTIENLAKLVKEMTNSSSEIIYIPYAEAFEEGFEDMPRRVPDLGKN